MKKPSLSVVIANFNHGHYLQESLKAILNQSYRPIEVIIIDDCSTDNSVDVIKSFAHLDSTVRFYRNDKNMGTLYSGNRGLSLATGEYVYFGAADDCICPGLFEKSITILAKYPNAGLCSALIYKIGPSGENLGWIRTPVISNKPSFFLPKDIINKLNLYGSWFAGQTVIYRRDALVNDLGEYHTELGHRADHFFNYALALNHGACFIPEVLATYRILPTGYAERAFANIDFNRKTFENLIDLMRSNKFASLFPVSFVNALEFRGRSELEVNTLMSVLRSHINFIDRLKVLSCEQSLMDKIVLFLIRIFVAIGGTITKIYIMHRIINWDLRILWLKLKTRFQRIPTMPNHLFQTCALCGSKTISLFTAIDENRRISKVPYAYLKCLECRGIFLEKPPIDLGRYYQSSYYLIPTRKKLQKLADKNHNKIDTVLRFAKRGSLLEVSPAFGVFAWQAKQSGFEVDAIEMDVRCCEYLQGSLGIKVTQSEYPELAMKAMHQHEVIAIWHGLEHLSDPLAFLRAAATNLKRGGVLVIATPNPDAWQFKIMGRHWPHLDAPRHLTLIPLTWLTRHAVALGLEQVYLTSDDSDARVWNRFGWQRLLMNRFSNKLMQRAMSILGFALSLIMAPFDRKNFGGSAYTVVYKKK
jgi:glycosyltransferase involved in cell wall biosynthesis